MCPAERMLMASPGPDLGDDAKHFFLFNAFVDADVPGTRHGEEDFYYIRVRAIPWYNDSVDTRCGSHCHLNVDIA